MGDNLKNIKCEGQSISIERFMVYFILYTHDSLGQSTVLQRTVSFAAFASHGSPSGSGAGLLHCRDRVLIPPAQEAEHSENDVQGLQPPFTCIKSGQLANIEMIVETSNISFN